MPYQNHHRFPQNTDQPEKMQQDHNLLTRVVLSEELNRKMKKFGESSFRVLYYGDHSSGSVPFMWESQPGTPKHPLSETRLPPLTPPPSFSYDLVEKPTNHYSSSSKPSFLQTIFMSSRRSSNTQPGLKSLSSSSVNSSLSSSTSYSCSSYSLPSTPMNNYHLRCSGGKKTAMAYGLPRGRSDVQEEAGSGSSPRSTLCFSSEDHEVSRMDDRGRGQRRMKKMKSAFLSIFVRGEKLQG